jgi:hypothetical protein
LRCSLIVALVALPAVAHAFAEPAQFFPIVPHSATYGPSGEGVYFTGAPRFASQTCASCHVDGPGVVGLRLGADDPSLFADGYQPGATYRLQVELVDEVAGTRFSSATCTDPPSDGDSFNFVPCNNNGFALEIDAAGVPLSGPGVFCAARPASGACPAPTPEADQSVVAPDGDAVFANRARSSDPNRPKLILRNDPRSWDLWWTAPKAGSGPLTIYVAAVDGNGGDGSAANDQDPYGDDTVQANFFIQERNAPVGNRASAACSVAPHADASPGWMLLLLAGACLLIAARARLRA